MTAQRTGAAGLRRGFRPGDRGRATQGRARRHRDRGDRNVETGETYPAKHGRTAFRRNFRGPWVWRDRTFDTKQLEVYAVEEDGDWLVITALVKFF